MRSGNLSVNTWHFNKKTPNFVLLANVNSPICRRPSVCRLSVCNVRALHHTQGEIFGNVSTPFSPLAIC